MKILRCSLYLHHHVHFGDANSSQKHIFLFTYALNAKIVILVAEIVVAIEIKVGTVAGGRHGKPPGDKTYEKSWRYAENEQEAESAPSKNLLGSRLIAH